MNDLELESHRFVHDPGCMRLWREWVNAGKECPPPQCVCGMWQQKPNPRDARIRTLERELRACLDVLRRQRPITHGHHCSCGVCVRLRSVEQTLEGGR